MNGEKKSDFVREWESKINSGLKYRKKYSTEDLWKGFRSQYRGRWDPRLYPINRVFSMGKSMIPRVYFRTPSILATPYRPEFAAHALVLEAIDNYLVRELNLKYTLKKAILDAYICGTGPIKLGYDSEFGYLPFQSVDKDTSTVTQVGAKTGEFLEYRVDVKPGMPWAIRVKPDDIVTPWGYDDPKALPWIAHAIFRPLRDVKEDQKYVNTTKLQGGYRQQWKVKSPFADMEVDDELYCLLWEIRDVRTRRVYVICEGEVLLDEEDSLQIEGLPYEFIIFNEDPEHFWGISDVFINSPQQKELNEIRTQASKNRKASVIKFLYKKGVFTKEELEKLLSLDVEDIGVGIEVQDDSPATSVLPFQPMGTTNDTTMETREIEKDMRETAGMGVNQLGEFSPFHGKTATEAQIVQMAAETRLDERRDIVADVLCNIVRKWNQYIFKYWTGEKVVEVVGPDNARYWVRYTGEQLKGEYLIKVDPESGLPVSKGMRYQMSKELLQMLGQDPFIDQPMLRRMLLRQFEWLDPTAALLVREPSAQFGMPGATQQPEVLNFDEFQRRLAESAAPRF